MKKVIIIPDSFKGTLSAKQICRILKEKVHQQFPACEVVTVPVADGGEGSVDCFLEALGGRKETVQVHGPYMELMEAEYGILSDGTADPGGGKGGFEENHYRAWRFLYQ